MSETPEQMAETYRAEKSESKDFGVFEWVIVSSDCGIVMARCWHEQMAHEVADALNAAALRAQGRETGQWLPIETAPKDGTPVLIVWLDDEGVWQQRRAWFERQFEGEGYADDEAQTTIWRQAWTDNRVASFGCEEVWEYEPTHWMPLPSPPVTQEK